MENRNKDFNQWERGLAKNRVLKNVDKFALQNPVSAGKKFVPHITAVSILSTK